MTRAICIALVLLSTTYAHAEFKKVRSLVHRGMCEASAAVALPGRSSGQLFIVANDEDNVLRAYSAETDGGPIPVTSDNLNTHLGLDPDKKKHKVDFEGATTLNGKIYWIGSHGRDGDGEIRKARRQFFSTAVVADERTINLSPSPSSHDLLKQIAALDEIFTNAIKLGKRKSAKLDPEKKGLNIEGLTARADGRSMFIGLRNPLSRKKKAFLIPFENPEAVAEHGKRPVLGRPVKLDLGGRGVRSIEYSPAANAYFIIAGPNGNSGSFVLYRWSGNPKDDPVAVKGSAAEFADIEDFHPEAMFIDPSGENFHILSDDGERKVGPGKTCQDIKDPDAQSFRSFVFTIT